MRKNKFEAAKGLYEQGNIGEEVYGAMLEKISEEYVSGEDYFEYKFERKGR